MKEEMSKLHDRMIAQTKIELDEKWKKVQEEFNNSTNFIQTSLKDEIATVCEYALHNEQYSRKNGVRVFGITEDDGENVEGKVIESFKSNLKVDVSSNDVEVTHRIGQWCHVGSTAEQRPRQIIVKFGNHKTKQKIMMCNSTLCGTDYQIQEDLTLTIYKRLQDLKKCEKAEKCWSIDGKIKFKLNGDSTVHMIRDGLDFYNVIHG